MNSGLLLCLALVSGGDLFAGELDTNSLPRNLTNTWKYIDYPFPKLQEKWNGGPIFLLTSGVQWEQVSRGLRLDIMNIVQGFRFIKTNGVTARLYRTNGEIVEPTLEGGKWLKLPVGGGSSYPGEELIPGVLTYFPWTTNTLEESWIEVSIPPDRYWLEVPYGFDRNPADPLPSAIPGGPPQFSAAMKSLTEHDHVVRWQDVHYDLGRTPDGGELSLIQSNPFDAVSDVDIYNFPKPQNVYSPHTDVRLLYADGKVIKGQCVNHHLDDNHLRRTDTFDIFDRGPDDLRCWGQIEVNIDGKTYHVVVPSSLYKYIHGHAFEPAATGFLSKLRIGMTFEEADMVSRNYINNGIRNYLASGHQYTYVFTPDTNEVTLQFDASDNLVSWK